MEANAILERIRLEYERILGGNLAGIYVHGSLAFGCYNAAVSDIDFIVAVNEPPTQEEKCALIRVLLELDPVCPKKGLEMSVVLAKYCLEFVYPTPYELHFSVTHKARAVADIAEYCRTMNGTDKDLAAHFTVIRAVGYELCGTPVGTMFGEVPREAYIDSLFYDIGGAVEDIADAPVYVTLNLCRVIAYLQSGVVMSKKQGGEWGICHLPKRYHAVISSALAAYTRVGSATADARLSREFAKYAMEVIIQ